MIDKIKRRFQHIIDTNATQSKAYFKNLDREEWKDKIKTLSKGDRITVHQDNELSDIAFFTWKIGLRLKHIEPLVEGNSITYVFEIESIQTPFNYLLHMTPVDLTVVHPR